MKMSLAINGIVLTGLAYMIFNFFSYARPEWVCVILSTLTFGLLVISVPIVGVLGFRRWRKSSKFWPIPMLLCLVFISTAWLVPPIGRSVADRRFENHILDYQHVVDELRSDPSIASSGDNFLVSVATKRLPNNVKALNARRCGDNAIVVAFFSDTDVPLLHVGYVYKSLETSDTCVQGKITPESNWPYIRQVSGNWYHFSNQPGL